MDFPDVTSRSGVLGKEAIHLTNFWDNVPVFNGQPFACQSLIDIASLLIRRRIDRPPARCGKYTRTPRTEQLPDYRIATTFTLATRFQTDRNVDQYQGRLPVMIPKAGHIWKNVDLPTAL